METEAGNTPFAPAKDRGTPGIDLSTDLEPCEPQEPGRGLSAPPGQLPREPAARDRRPSQHVGLGGNFGNLSQVSFVPFLSLWQFAAFAPCAMAGLDD